LQQEKILSSIPKDAPKMTDSIKDEVANNTSNHWAIQEDKVQDVVTDLLIVLR